MKAAKQKTSQRCGWADGDPMMRAYHDTEWGVPQRDSRALWGKLVLDGFQAGLSWRTILHKRQALVEAFAGFDPEKIAKFTAADVERLMNNPGIIRSRAKIMAAIGNAKAYLAMEKAGEDFADFVWNLAGGKPIDHRPRAKSDVPAKTELSETISKELKKRGFTFVGPVIVYAWMQGVGIVNDHLATCPCRKKKRRRFDGARRRDIRTSHV